MRWERARGTRERTNIETQRVRHLRESRWSSIKHSSQRCQCEESLFIYELTDSLQIPQLQLNVQLKRKIILYINLDLQPCPRIRRLWAHRSPVFTMSLMFQHTFIHSLQENKPVASTINEPSFTEPKLNWDWFILPAQGHGFDSHGNQ